MTYLYPNNDAERLMTVEQYIAGIMPGTFAKDDVWINNIGCVTGNSDDFFAVQTEAGKFRLMPGPEFCPRMYRGQNQYYPQCKASIYRKDDCAGYVIDFIKQHEFFKLICSSPIATLMEHFTIMNCAFSMDLVGLAQHYELATEMMDFTRSKDIAMFFASCKRNDKTKQYEPNIDDTKDAVLYTVDMKKMCESGEPLNIIGIQPLLRPYRQMALSISQAPSDNLNTKSYIHVEKLKIDKNHALKVFEQFEGGTKLFPEDSVYSKAREIKESNTLDEEVIEVMLRHNLFPPEVNNKPYLEKIANDKHMLIADKSELLLFSQAEKEKIVRDWQQVSFELDKKIQFRCCADSNGE